MKRVLSLSQSAELELLRNVLEEGGIHCVLKNARVVPAMPAAPFKAEELWVLNDGDLPPAQALCHDWFNPDSDDWEAWDCPLCGQRLGSRFETCWKCGAKRGTGGKPTRKGIIL